MAEMSQTQPHIIQNFIFTTLLTIVLEFYA